MDTSVPKHSPIGILGGTFDPIHHGHLRLAIELYERLNLAEVRLLPSARPPHRAAPSSSPELRYAMLQAAIADTQGLTADDRELRRPGTSYMIDTLYSLREEFPQRSLCLILGMDAFISLPHWREWEKFIELAHIVVVKRPGKLLPMVHTMRDFLNVRGLHHPKKLHKRLSGYVWVEEIPSLTISATQIRALLANGQNPRYLLPLSVLKIIETHQLYRHV